MAKLDFLKDFSKELDEMDGVGTSSTPPRYWYSTGNFVLNRIISGSFYKGIPQGRITNLAGSSGAGKSFLAANIVRSAQQAGAMILVVDSENALDDEFMRKIGVDTKRDDYVYADVVTINDVAKVVSRFLKGYKDSFGHDEKAPQALILIDSLDMLITETEQEHYDKGVQKGDQGQKNKQLKQMLRTFIQDIKRLNVAMIVTSQVYKNQDVLNGEGLWIVSDAVKYSASQIILLSKLKLKEGTGTTKEVTGIRMKCEGYKTRFTKPFQTVVVEVPYDTGMDSYSGLLETGLDMGLIVKKGSRYQLKDKDETWYASEIEHVAESVLLAGEAQSSAFLTAHPDAEVDETTETKDETAARRRRKLKEG
jgi:recombination protein RecA